MTKNPLYIFSLIIIIVSVSVLPSEASGTFESYRNCNASESTEKLYRMLEEVLYRKKEYSLQKEIRIDSLKHTIASCHNLDSKYSIYKKVYDEYFTYRADSAFYYLSLAEEIALKTKNHDYADECVINRSQLLATTGYFSQALELLDNINRSELNDTLLFRYFSAYEWVYSVWSEYSDDDIYSPQFRKKEIEYNDSMLSVIDHNTVDYLYWKAELSARKGDQYGAQKLYEKALVGLPFDTRMYACVACGLAFAYKRQGNLKQYEKYLILSSISDIVCPLKENLAMQELAMFLYENSESDLDKANRYLNHSMEDAMFYNNRLRMLEIARKFPPIVNSYQHKSNEKGRTLTAAVVFISILSVMLLLSLFYIYRQIIMLRLQRKAVTQMNEQLKNLNDELIKTNRTREEYVSLFLDLCASYIDKLNKYQDLVKRKVKAKQIDDLLKLANNSKMSDVDAKQFFVNFDTAFITLYPNFVSEFNKLLKDDEKIVPDKNEILNTELRIFALIRLGIKDSSRIATLLFYSPQTIYNYRSSVKNRAKNRDSFEDDVKNLCNICN